MLLTTCIKEKYYSDIVEWYKYAKYTDCKLENSDTYYAVIDAYLQLDNPHEALQVIEHAYDSGIAIDSTTIDKVAQLIRDKSYQDRPAGSSITDVCLGSSR
jgi:pentatricopeptide repeat protein